MAFFRNRNTDSAIASIEFSPQPEGNTSFVTLRKGADAEPVKQWLTEALGQQVEAQAQQNNKTILVTSGDKTQKDILSGLKTRGEDLAALQPPQKKKLNLWAIRGGLGMSGQVMQLTSSFLRNKMDVGLAGFAIANIVANCINFAFGSEKKDDQNHLRVVKEEVNRRLMPYLAAGEALPSSTDKRLNLRQEPEHKSVGRKLHDFVSRNSVLFGELGLRYLGAVSLVFPFVEKRHGKATISHWKEAAQLLFKEGEVKQAFAKIKNPDKFVFTAGAIWLAAKTVGFLVKTPDPYNPNQPDPHTLRGKFEIFREKYLFKIFGVAEMVAASTLAYNGFANVKVKIPNKSFIPEHFPTHVIPEKFPAMGFLPKVLQPRNAGVPLRGAPLRGHAIPDIIGGTGGLLFAAGYGFRIFAPMGTRTVDMKELDAHATDSLAKVSPGKLPQATADVAAYLTDHFKEQNLKFSEVYGKLKDDLYRYHNIAMPSADGGIGTIAKEASPEAAKSFARPELKKPDPAAMPLPATYQDRAAARTSAAMGLNA